MRKRFPCGHKGLGKFCHRCDTAEKLEKLATSKKTYKTHKKSATPKRWTVEELLVEVKRLREEGRR